MDPSISLITLGVTDLGRAVAFYRDGLGLETKGIVGQEIENGAVCFFKLRGGLRLALWPRKSIAADTGLQEGGSAPTSFTIAHNVDDEAAVDTTMAEATAAGATVFRAAQDVLWRLCRLFPGFGRPRVGGGVQPGPGRPRLTRLPDSLDIAGRT